MDGEQFQVKHVIYGGGVRTGNKTQRQSEDVNERTNTLIQALTLSFLVIYIQLQYK